MNSNDLYIFLTAKSKNCYKVYNTLIYYLYTYFFYLLSIEIPHKFRINTGKSRLKQAD